MLDLNSLMVGTQQPKALSEFYEKVFEKKPDMTDSEWAGWQVGSCFFGVGAHSEVKGKAKEPQRLILNLETAKVKEEFGRIKKIKGAKVVKEPYEMSGSSSGGQGMWIATLADPDGNYFQLMTPWEADMKN